MFVSKSMTRKVFTIDETESVFEAQDRMAKNNIRHLPVVDAENRLIGIVTDRDIRSALPWELFHGDAPEGLREKVGAMNVGDIMSRNPITISPEYTIQDTLLLIQERRVGAFPVVDAGGKLLGIISVRDLLRSFINVLNIGEPGTLLCILVEEKVGQMKKIVDAITEEGISIGSILVSHHWEKDIRAVFPYLMTLDVRRVKKKLADLGFTPLDPMQWYLDQLPRSE